jgi:predicted nucleotidyltransferase
MKVLGLITEYNPFHNGHLYHLRESKRISGASHTVAVMSGHFLQRGEPAIADKWTRAAMAVASGVDLVLELPVIYACSSADHFARGSILLLDQLGCVTDICFGSENGRLDHMDRISDVIAEPSPDYIILLKKELSKGLSFAAAQQVAVMQVLEQTSPDDQLKSVFGQPNNLLGIAYLTHLKNINSRMTAHTIQRVGAGYHDEKLHQKISSATGIRHQIKKSGDMDSVRCNIPDPAYQIMRRGISDNGGPVFISDFEPALMTLLKRAHEQELASLPHVTEGLENRIMRCIGKTGTLDDFFMCVKNKRVPYTRLQRMAMHLLLNIDVSMAYKWYNHLKPPYARILAFNHQGRSLIRHCREYAKIPFISKTAAFHSDDPLLNEMLMLDYRASRVYGTVLKNQRFSQGEPDKLMSPIYLPLQKPADGS